MQNGRIPPGFWLEHLRDVTEEPLIQFLFWVIVFELLTGVLLAVKQKRWTSSINLFGMLKHGLAFCFVLVIFNYADLLGYRTVGDGVTLGFLFNYAGSLLETWERSGIWFPESIKPYINTLRRQQEARLSKLTIDKLEITEEEIQQIEINRRARREEKDDNNRTGLG